MPESSLSAALLTAAQLCDDLSQTLLQHSPSAGGGTQAALDDAVDQAADTLRALGQLWREQSIWGTAADCTGTTEAATVTGQQVLARGANGSLGAR